MLKSHLLLSSVFLFAGCSSQPPAAPEEAEEVAAEVEAEAAPTLSKEQLEASAANVALVPSPVETQRALEAAGIQIKLADLVEPRTFKMDASAEDNAAIRTGVVLADMLLTVKSVSNEQLIAHLGNVKTGMSQLEGGADIQQTIADIQDRIKGEALTRDELLHELDELSGAVIPELKFNGRERVLPLIQAGSWLEGANLVAKALKQSGSLENNDGLLKQPSVVNYFIGYVKTEGQGKAPAAVTEKLEASLQTLKVLAEKEEPLTPEDLDTVIQTTNDVLALL